jgi:hypothetical protein
MMCNISLQGSGRHNGVGGYRIRAKCGKDGIAIHSYFPQATTERSLHLRKMKRGHAPSESTALSPLLSLRCEIEFFKMVPFSSWSPPVPLFHDKWMMCCMRVTRPIQWCCQTTPLETSGGRRDTAIIYGRVCPKKKIFETSLTKVLQSLSVFGPFFRKKGLRKVLERSYSVFLVKTKVS